MKRSERAQEAERAVRGRRKSFDAVILATGRRIARPAIPGAGADLVSTFTDVLRCAVSSCEFYPEDRKPRLDCGGTALVWGDHFCAAEKFAAEGRKVYVVTENCGFAQWMEPCHRDVLMKRFAGSNGEGWSGKCFEHPATMLAGTTVVEIRDSGELTLMDNSFSKSTLQVDNAVLASVESAESPYDELVAAGIVAVKIGDLKKVRNGLAAVKAGANAALTLDEGFTLNVNRALASRHPTEVTL